MKTPVKPPEKSPEKPSVRLLKLLDEKNVSQSLVGRMVEPEGVTPQSVGRWLKGLDDDSITDDQWFKFATALRKAGIDATQIGQIRPVPLTAARAQPPNIDLLPYLEFFDDADQLRALIVMLGGSEESIGILRIFAAQKLRLIEKP